MGLEMLLVWQIKGGSVWAPEHVAASIAMGRGVLPPAPPDVHTWIFIVGLLINFALAIIFALILSWMVAHSLLWRALMIGATFGFALYFIDFYLFVNVWPWFSNAHGGVTIFTHVVFGIVAAAIYCAWRGPRRVVAREEPLGAEEEPVEPARRPIRTEPEIR
jgi:membrane associated rhomboid family serine protease